MAIFGMVLALIAMLGAGGYWIDSNADERATKREQNVCLEKDNAEIRQLNAENIELINNYNLLKAKTDKESEDKDVVTNKKLAEIRAKGKRANDDLHSTYKLLLDEARSEGENEVSVPEDVRSTLVNRGKGTEGSKLAPESVRDIEQVSLAGDKAIVLQRSCADKYEKLRKRSIEAGIDPDIKD